MMAVYSLPLTAVALGAVAIYGRGALPSSCGRLRAATEEALVHEARQNSHFLESRARRAGHQAVRRPGRPPQRAYAALVARHHERRHHHAQARAGHGAGAAPAVRPGACRRSSGWAPCWCWSAQLSVGMLFAFFAYKEQFAQRVSRADRQAGWHCACCGVQGERLADIVLTPPEADGSHPRGAAVVRAGGRHRAGGRELPLRRRRARRAAAASACASSRANRWPSPARRAAARPRCSS